MNDDFLWDRSGSPDKTVEALERALAPLADVGEMRLTRAKRMAWWKPCMAIAASVVVFWFGWSVIEWRGTSDWRRVSGQSFAAGEKIVTDSVSRLTLTSDETGRIDLAPNSELHLPRRGPREPLSLAHGRMRAFIWAPPGNFVVSTPAAQTVDLGCEYDLTVNPDGSGFFDGQYRLGGFAGREQ